MYIVRSQWHICEGVVVEGVERVWWWWVWWWRVWRECSGDGFLEHVCT